MPVQREDKPPWSVVPLDVRAAVDRVLGSPAVRAVRAYGGYGPSATYLLTKADGSRAFFKGTYPLPGGSAVEWSLDREERIYRRLGSYIRPWAPTYLGSVKADGWHVVLLESVGGARVVPWTRAKAGRAARSYARFHRSTLGLPMPKWLSRTEHVAFATYWQRLAADEAAVGRLATIAGRQRADAAAWLIRNLDPLQRAEQNLARAKEPFALLHFDTRSDNIRLEGDLLRIFDWPFAAVGPPEFDVAAFAQSIESEGGPVAEAVVGWYEAVQPLRHEVLVGSVAGIAGYFADRAPRPTPAGLPRLRPVQRLQLKASLSWAARLLDLPAPSWLSAVEP